MMSPRPPVEVLPVGGVPEVRPGDDLAEVLEPGLREAGARERDVVIVTSKIVSKSEGRLVSGDRAEAVAAETARVVARRGDLVIAETRHGFVCANAGVDASNVDPGTLALLPADPDASARALRASLSDRLEVRDLAVVVSDTFGRAWRTGLVNVAIGCAGLPPLVDLRGRPDDRGRTLESTEVALADEVAAAGGLVMAKHARIPTAIVRGVDRLGGRDDGARALVRPAGEDLFRTSPIQALHERPTARSFDAGDVPRSAIEEAIVAGGAALDTADAQRWRATVLASDAARRMASPTSAPSEGPVVLVPWLALDPDRPLPAVERDRLLLAGGAAVQNLLLALSALGLWGRWTPPSPDHGVDAVALGISVPWLPLGTITCGRPTSGVDPRPEPIDIDTAADRRS